MTKKYKILTDSFRQYSAVSSNTFLWGKKNIITKENVKSIIKSFCERRRDIFVYKKHKSHPFEEREPIGKVKDIFSENGSELFALIEWNDNAKNILQNSSFYPSVEFTASVEFESENFVYWKEPVIKAIAAVEEPASKGVSILCAAERNEKKFKGEKNMIEKIKEILIRIKDGDEDSKKELVEILKKDNAMIEAFVEMICEKDSDVSSEDVLDKNADESVDNKNMKLSSEMWEKMTRDYAISQNGQRCSAKSVSKTLRRAQALQREGEHAENILCACKNDLVVLGIANERFDNMNLSAYSDETYREIARMFEPHI